jgi:hypothetical protein
MIFWINTVFEKWDANIGIAVEKAKEDGWKNQPPPSLPRGGGERRIVEVGL